MALGPERLEAIFSMLYNEAYNRNEDKPMKKLIKRAFVVLVILGVAGIVCLAAVNTYMIKSTEKRILTWKEASSLGADCILVLGAGVHPDGKPSNMLEDRLLRGIELYEAGASEKLLMSGDHGRKNYDEVNAMKQFAVDRGVPSEDVFMDHAGFSTYESMYRARDVFEAEKIIIVTQQYHLYRALYAAKQLGLDAYGVASDQRTYAGQKRRDVRELLARGKDFMTGIFQPEPTYLGEAIPVNGDGNVTNDSETERGKRGWIFEEYSIDAKMADQTI